MNITDIFGMNVFSKSVMKERLPKKIYQEMVDVMENHLDLVLTHFMVEILTEP